MKSLQMRHNSLGKLLHVLRSNTRSGYLVHELYFPFYPQADGIMRP